MSESQENLKRFKIVYSSQYIQIVPLLPSFKTQILINKRTSEIQFEPLAKQYEFSGEFSTRYASLILGLAEIEGDYFLVFVETVYVQTPFPPLHSGMYQIASIGYLEFGSVVSNREREIFSTMKTEIFNFSFYFCFERDLTLSFQKQRTDEKPKSREAYFWNHAMIKAMMSRESVAQWFVPVIQGHYGSFELTLGSQSIRYYLLSRRSKYRSGTRFYNRGIDENSKCAQFIETEQILLRGTELSSFVSLSGSAPLFWEQKSQGDKIRLTRNKELTTLPFLEHLNNIRHQFGRVFIVNLLERKKDSENLLLQAYEQLVDENGSNLGEFLRYIYLDINESFKSKNYQQIFSLLHRLDPILKEFGFFRYNTLRNQTTSTQTGVFRTNCLDCLSRTNKFLQVLFFYMLSEELFMDRILNEHTTNASIKDLLFGEEPTLSPLMAQFRTLWQQKADFESMIYAGSRATNGKKNKFLDDLQDSFISLQRLYNQKFIDEIKQKSLDIILYHKHYRMDSMLKNKQNTELQLCIATWNLNATDPDKLKQLQTVVEACDGADLVVFGFQEMIELTTNNVMTNNQEESETSVKWGKTLEKLLNARPDKKIFVQKVEMVGLLLVMFISDQWKHAIKSVQKDTVRTGMGGQFGNKGAVVLRVRLFETTLCFVCAHLTAGHSKPKERVEDFVQIHKKAFQQNKVGVQNEVQIEESNYKFFFGDLNFRINGEFKDVKDMLDNCETDLPSRKEAINKLIESDQLSLIKKDPATPYLLASYEENEINFLPTYKLEKATGRYTEERSRIPSWCDRILYWPNNEPDHDCECLQYRDVAITGSDHRPVLGRFRLIVNQPIRSSTMMQYGLAHDLQ